MVSVSGSRHFDSASTSTSIAPAPATSGSGSGSGSLRESDTVADSDESDDGETTCRNGSRTRSRKWYPCPDASMKIWDFSPSVSAPATVSDTVP